MRVGGNLKELHVETQGINKQISKYIKLKGWGSGVLYPS